MTSEDLQTCSFKKDYFEFRKVLSSKAEPVGHLTCGSFFEMPLLYFLSNPTDIDIMYCDMTLCAIFDHVTIPARLARNVLTIDTKDCHVGFARLRNGAEYLCKYKLDMEEGPAYTYQLSFKTTCLRAVLGKIYNRWGNIWMLGKDNVYAVSCPLWPQDAHKWITRKRSNGWPSNETIIAIVKIGCQLVSKPHANNRNDDTQWRYSFSQAETILIHNNWTGVQKYIYHLLRIIKTDVVNKCGGKNKTFISNYYFKTLMLWACEEKPSVFWEDRNIVTSVRELLLDFIERLIEGNVPHYFMPTNNLMDVLQCGSDIYGEIRSLLSYTEDRILELVGLEPKAYQMTPGYIVMPNQSLYPLAFTLSNFLYLPGNKVDDKQLKESKILSICSSNYFFPELEYLHKGIMMQLQLSKLNTCENQKRREELIISAENLFDKSIQKFGYGFTRFRIHLGWSLSEFYQQLWRLCGGEKFQNRNQMLYSGSCRPMPVTAFTSCYVRDEDDYLKNHCSIAPYNMGTTNLFSILQYMMLKEITVPLNSTYFVCSAYRANFFCNALCNYRRALELCKEANKHRDCFSNFRGHLFMEHLHFPLKHEWCGLYDKYIQIVLGFIRLYRAETNRNRMIPVYISAVQYLSYIYTRCSRILNEPIADFGFDYKRLCRDRINITMYQNQFTDAILRTALYISEPHSHRPIYGSRTFIAKEEYSVCQVAF